MRGFTGCRQYVTMPAIKLTAEVHGGAVLDVLNLAQFLELIGDGFRRRALAPPRDDINALGLHFLHGLPVGIALVSVQGVRQA